MNENELVTCDCKIGRNAAKYNIPNLPDYVKDRRTEADLSLRDLAKEVNIRLVEAVLERADADVAGDPESVYVALTDEDIPPERQLSVRNQLTDIDIPIDKLEEDFVSYQAIRYHLQTCLSMDTSREGITSLSEGREIIANARERDQEIITQTLRRLQRVDELHDTDIKVRISPRVSCQSCGQSYGLEEFLETGGCPCE